MYTEGSLGCGRTVWRSRGAVAAVIPADGCVDVILRGDDVHLAGPSTVCIPTSPDIGETIGIRFDPGLAAGVLRFNPAEVRDLATPLRDVVGVARAAEVARVLCALRSFGAAPRADLLASPVDGWVGLIRRAAAAGTGAAQVAGEIGWSTRHLRRRMLATFGYGYGALVRVARMRRALSLMKSGSGFLAGPATGSRTPTTRCRHDPPTDAHRPDQPDSRDTCHLTLADVAHTAGYADQAHMTRDFRHLVGRTPAQVAGSQA